MKQAAANQAAGNSGRLTTAAKGMSTSLTKVVRLLGALSSTRHTTQNAQSDLHYRELEALLTNEYRDFASRENYPEEADAYIDLQKIFSRLDELRMAPRLADKNICAVAGGFSSGKSSFLNKLIGKDILPTNIDATTAIPTYMLHVEGATRVAAFNRQGGEVSIDTDTFKEMTHDFKKLYNVDIQNFLHRISIYTQALSSWRNVAFLDTPGYSNPGDEGVALANVLKSEFLIWIVDSERGTLPQHDIHFIRKFVEGRPSETDERAYLVFNKGEGRDQKDRQAILQVAEKSARENEIPFAGIGIYSSHKNEWFAHRGVDFQSFLQGVDQAQSSATTGLDDAVEEVFQRYVDYHDQERTQLVAAFGLLTRLFNLTHEGGTETEKLHEDLKKRRTYIWKAKINHEELRDEALQLQKRFVALVQSFVDSLNAA